MRLGEVLEEVNRKERTPSKIVVDPKNIKFSRDKWKSNQLQRPNKIALDKPADTIKYSKDEVIASSKQKQNLWDDYEVFDGFDWRGQLKGIKHVEITEEHKGEEMGVYAKNQYRNIKVVHGNNQAPRRTSMLEAAA